MSSRSLRPASPATCFPPGHGTRKHATGPRHALRDGSPEPNRFPESPSTGSIPGAGGAIVRPRQWSEYAPRIWDDFCDESIGSVRNRRRLDVGRQSHDEAGSAVRRKVGADLSTVQGDDLPTDIQPESQTLRGILGAGLEEALENPIACLDRNPDATIADGELECAGQGPGERHDDWLSRGTVLDGIIEKIGKDLLESQRVDPGLQRRRHLQRNGVPVSPGSRAADHLFHQYRQVSYPALQRQVVGL